MSERRGSQWLGRSALGGFVPCLRSESEWEYYPGGLWVSWPSWQYPIFQPLNVLRLSYLRNKLRTFLTFKCIIDCFLPTLITGYVCFGVKETSVDNSADCNNILLWSTTTLQCHQNSSLPMFLMNKLLVAENDILWHIMPFHRRPRHHKSLVNSFALQLFLLKTHWQAARYIAVTPSYTLLLQI